MFEHASCSMQAAGGRQRGTRAGTMAAHFLSRCRSRSRCRLAAACVSSILPAACFGPGGQQMQAWWVERLRGHVLGQAGSQTQAHESLQRRTCSPPYLAPTMTSPSCYPPQPAPAAHTPAQEQGPVASCASNVWMECRGWMGNLGNDKGDSGRHLAGMCTDPAFLRPHEMATYVGSASKCGRLRVE